MYENVFWKMYTAAFRGKRISATVKWFRNTDLCTHMYVCKYNVYTNYTHMDVSLCIYLSIENETADAIKC